MTKFKVIYLTEDMSIKSKYVIASSKEEARAIVYGNTIECSQTLLTEAEL